MLIAAAAVALLAAFGGLADACHFDDEIRRPVASLGADSAHGWFHRDVLEPSPFPSPEYANATCIVLHESDFDPTVVNHNTNDTTDTSGWQINSGWATTGWNPAVQRRVGLYDPSRATDWAYTTNYAYTIWKFAYADDGSNPTWKSWATAHLCHLN